MNKRTLIVSALVCFTACGPLPMVDAGVEFDAGTEVDSGVADSGVADAGVQACGATPVTCSDQAQMELAYKSNLATGAITEESTTAGEFTTFIDASAGGLNPTMSFVYARFTATGLERVDVSDTQAETDATWDIAFRRYFIRLNSGVSGPSCVQGARTAVGTTFEDVTTVDANLNFSNERYFTESCVKVDDGSGLGGPAMVLSGFWSYPGCVRMTGNVYVVKLADGRHVKLEVKSYYSLANQTTCQASNTISTPSGAGSIRIRWAFVP